MPLGTGSSCRPVRAQTPARRLEPRSISEVQKRVAFSSAKLLPVPGVCPHSKYGITAALAIRPSHPTLTTHSCIFDVRRNSVSPCPGQVQAHLARAEVFRINTPAYFPNDRPLYPFPGDMCPTLGPLC